MNMYEWIGSKLTSITFLCFGNRTATPPPHP
jgi:hypothetical protein